MTRREEEMMLIIKGRMYDDLYHNWMQSCEKVGYLKHALKIAEEKLSRYEQRQKKGSATPAKEIIKGCDFYAN